MPEKSQILTSLDNHEEVKTSKTFVITKDPENSLTLKLGALLQKI